MKNIQIYTSIYLYMSHWSIVDIFKHISVTNVGKKLKT